MRAFFYFYLVNLYGDVPLVLSTDYKLNALLLRTDKQLVYDQIINDLKEAKTELSDNFLDGKLNGVTVERVRPTKWSATALLARAYLYKKDYANAEIESSEVISNTALFSLQTCDSAFLKNNNEAIWQLQPISASTPNTPDAMVFVIPSTGMSQFNPVSLSSSLVASFEPADNRRSKWVDTVTVLGTKYYYPYKYKINGTDIIGEEYLTFFRLAEQYLIRAEARAEQDKLEESLEDLNQIRSRAGLADKTTLDKPTILADILHERQIEFFSELGHRWLDLKRTDAIDSVMTTATQEKRRNMEFI